MSSGPQHVIKDISPDKGRPVEYAVDGSGSFTLGDFAVDEYRPIKVVVIGAGFSGIIAGIRFVNQIVKFYAKAESLIPRYPQRIPNG
jgi:hypothetical protein